MKIHNPWSLESPEVWRKRKLVRTKSPGQSLASWKEALRMEWSGCSVGQELCLGRRAAL